MNIPHTPQLANVCSDAEDASGAIFLCANFAISGHSKTFNFCSETILAKTKTKGLLAHAKGGPRFPCLRTSSKKNYLKKI